MATLNEAVYSWFSGLTALQAIIGARIMPSVPSQATAYPCAVLKFPQSANGHNLDGADGTGVATVEITALALQQSQCLAIAEAIRNSADGFRGTQSDVAIMSFLQTDTADGDPYPPPDGSDEQIRNITIEYRCKYRLPAPTSVTQTNV